MYWKALLTNKGYNKLIMINANVNTISVCVNMQNEYKNVQLYECKDVAWCCIKLLHNNEVRFVMSNVDEHSRVSNKVGTEVEYSHSDIVIMRNAKI